MLNSSYEKLKVSFELTMKAFLHRTKQKVIIYACLKVKSCFQTCLNCWRQCYMNNKIKPQKGVTTFHFHHFEKNLQDLSSLHNRSLPTIPPYHKNIAEIPRFMVVFYVIYRAFITKDYPGCAIYSGGEVAISLWKES